MNTLHIIITVLTTIAATLTAVYSFTKDTKEFINTILGIGKGAKHAIEAHGDSTNAKGETVRPSGLIIPKATTYHTRERIRYDH